MELEIGREPRPAKARPATATVEVERLADVRLCEGIHHSPA